MVYYSEFIVRDQILWNIGPLNWPSEMIALSWVRSCHKTCNQWIGYLGTTQRWFALQLSLPTGGLCHYSYCRPNLSVMTQRDLLSRKPSGLAGAVRWCCCVVDVTMLWPVYYYPLLALGFSSPTATTPMGQSMISTFLQKAHGILEFRQLRCHLGVARIFPAAFELGMWQTCIGVLIMRCLQCAMSVRHHCVVSSQSPGVCQRSLAAWYHIVCCVISARVRSKSNY